MCTTLGVASLGGCRDSRCSVIWFRRTAFGLALLGAILTLLGALAGGFFMGLGNASDSGGNPAPPMPWPQLAYFPGLLAAAGLAVAFALVMRRRPRLGALLGACAVLLGAGITAYCVYDVSAVLAEWFVVTSPVTVAAAMCLFVAPAAKKPKRPMEPSRSEGTPNKQIESDAASRRSSSAGR